MYAMHAAERTTLVDSAPEAPEAPVIPLRPRGESLATITRCAQTVLRELGAGLEPLFYARALSLQLQTTGQHFEREAWIDFRFRGSSLGRRRVDFLFEDLAIELVSGPRIEAEDVHRMRTIIHSAGLATGMLLCFTSEPLQLRLVRSRTVSAAR